MKTATSVLRKEHDAILKMLDVTEEIARRAKQGIPVPTSIYGELLEFFKVFADRCHHKKEEGLLFPALEGKGLPHQNGPIAVMLSEHELGRELIGAMSRAAGEISDDRPGAATRWAAAALEYSALLRAHINKENNILFMMAERLLSEAEQAELAEAFDRHEIEEMGAGTHERLHESMRKLEEEIFAASRAVR